jgi:tetratricopeptide (TPR) repeat protein
LRATIAWSYELLSPSQQQLFAQLAVFAGGCALEAVEHVCSADLETLAALLDNSLLLREQTPGREPRFRMLATVRDYAEELLSDEARAATRERHAAYFLDLVERKKNELDESGAREAEILDSLELEDDNLRAALRWAHEQGEREMLLRLVSGLRLYWTVRGHLEEGQSWFEAALDESRTESEEHRGTALAGGGTLAYRRGDYATARRWWEEARLLYERKGDAARTARTLGDLAAIALAEHDLDLATELWQESCDRLRRLGEDIRLAIALANLGVASSAQQRYEEAVTHLDEALAIAERLNDESTAGAILFNLGRAHVNLGRLEEGTRLMQDALRIAHELGYRELTAHCLLGLADVAATCSDVKHAEQLLRASDDLVATVGIQFQPEEIDLRERTLARVGGGPSGQTLPPVDHRDATERALVWPLPACR